MVPKNQLSFRKLLNMDDELEEAAKVYRLKENY